MSATDWTVLFAALAAFVAYGVWRGRGERNLTDFLLAGRAMRWPTVALSVMATQASAVTFLSTPGQGFADGLRFVQFYFGLPLAMVVVCLTAVPIFQRLGVFTAYEYLERRFDGRTRSLAAGLFLIQRGLAAGITIYAPALVLSVILGWDVRWTCVMLGGLAVIYTTTGGSKAVSHSHVLQFLIIMATMAVAFALVLRSLPAGVSPGDAAFVAAHSGKLNALELKFDPQDRYNLWSGLIGGFFLQLSYFGTDQSQVGRYLTGRSIAESRLGLVFNGLVKVPMQLFILSLGVLVFVFYQFVAPPLFFNPTESARLASGPDSSVYEMLEVKHRIAVAERESHVRALLDARHAGDRAGVAAASTALVADRDTLAALRRSTAALIKTRDPGANTSDTNYIFLGFVRGFLPVGLIGLVFAAIFAASMNSSSAELNALTSTTVVDVWRRIVGPDANPHHEVTVSRLATLAWAGFAVAFAEYASRLGSLIEAVNIIGSLFYGTILGIFLVAFWLPRVRGPAVFVAALVAEAVVIACFKLTPIGFLWYNLIGCAAVVVVALVLQSLFGRARPAAGEVAAT
jgi:SSS family transporter